jgi:integrase
MGQRRRSATARPAPCDAPAEDTLKGIRDRAILATILYHGIRREELCRLRVRHLRIHGKRDKITGTAGFGKKGWPLPVRFDVTVGFSEVRRLSFQIGKGRAASRQYVFMEVRGSHF